MFFIYFDIFAICGLFLQYNEIGTKMETIYSSAKICRFNSTECGLSLEPGKIFHLFI